MYADFPSEQVKAFLRDLTEQPKSAEVSVVAEAFSDEMILAEMELQRCKKDHAAGRDFVPRSVLMDGLRRAHPADFQ